jgi:hypothetical protein
MLSPSLSATTIPHLRNRASLPPCVHQEKINEAKMDGNLQGSSCLLRSRVPEGTSHAHATHRSAQMKLQGGLQLSQREC